MTIRGSPVTKEQMGRIRGASSTVSIMLHLDSNPWILPETQAVLCSTTTLSVGWVLNKNSQVVVSGRPEDIGSLPPLEVGANGNHPSRGMSAARAVHK
jgi:hypothetical protein